MTHTHEKQLEDKHQIKIKVANQDQTEESIIIITGNTGLRRHAIIQTGEVMMYH